MRAWHFMVAGVAVGIVAALYKKAPSIRAALSQIGEPFNRLHPIVQQRAERVLDDAAAEFAADGLTVGVFEGWRDLDKQTQHIASGASFVAEPLNSYHVWGLAVDFVFIDHLGRWTWLEKAPGQGWDKWDRLGAIIERHGFEWGGRWKRRDGPHAQAPDVARVASLRAGYADPLQFIETFNTEAA